MSRGNRGFTLVELLCALAVLLLLGAGVHTGIHLASEAYRDSIRQSAAQTLCATLEERVALELREATGFTWQQEQLVFRGRSYGTGSSFATNAQGQLELKGNPVLPPQAYPQGVEVRFQLEKAEHQEGILLLRLEIWDTEKQHSLAQRETEILLLNF